MPPKRGQKSATTTTTKRRKAIQFTDVTQAAPLQLPPVEPPAQNEILNIDYDKLAATILKQSHAHNGLSLQPQEAPSVPAATSHSSETLPKSTADPQSSSVPGPSSQQPSAQQPSTQQLSAQQPSAQQPTSSVSSSTPVLGTLLDQVFAGEPARASDLPYSSTIVSDGIPLGSSVSSKLKSKIWNNEFIDFQSLQNTREEPLSVSISTGVIKLHQSPKFKSPISISQWTDAFFVFSAVYIEKYPAEAPNLLKYGHMEAFQIAPHLSPVQTEVPKDLLTI
ncbi:uncharacterized protein LOC134254984 isoform X3 [Saccostrea cucullata]|uniref:uncharacterized protein LOC134254984 isoform X3 n=1 Tax=Saccostrea cuccullata TaxID=36930 RepID=UPI002ED4AA42